MHKFFTRFESKTILHSENISTNVCKSLDRKNVLKTLQTRSRNNKPTFGYLRPLDRDTDTTRLVPEIVSERIRLIQ